MNMPLPNLHSDRGKAKVAHHNGQYALPIHGSIGLDTSRRDRHGKHSTRGELFVGWLGALGSLGAPRWAGSGCRLRVVAC